jgi:hypothetical protein
MVEELRLREDGTIDCEFYIAQARRRREEVRLAQREWLDVRQRGTVVRDATPCAPVRVPRAVKGFAAAFALATAAFWATMATSPPVTIAAPPIQADETLSRMDGLGNMQRNVPLTLPHATEVVP